MKQSSAVGNGDAHSTGNDHDVVPSSQSRKRKHKSQSLPQKQHEDSNGDYIHAETVAGNGDQKGGSTRNKKAADRGADHRGNEEKEQQKEVLPPAKETKNQKKKRLAEQEKKPPKTDSRDEPGRKPLIASKNPFVPRPSPLDHSHEGSPLQTSEFRGFFNLLLMAGFFFVFASNGRYLIVEGTLVGLKALWRLIPLDMIPFWLVMVAASHLMVGIQKLRLLHSRWFPSWFTWTLYIAQQCTFFFGTIYFLLIRGWPIIPTGVCLGEMIVITMKMHSYFMRNRECEDELEAKELAASKKRGNKKKNGKKEQSAASDRQPQQHNSKGQPAADVQFPDNVTLGNYFYFLCAPTLVYELSYPRTNRMRPGYIFEKCITAVGVFSVLHIIVNRYITPVLLELDQVTMVESIATLIMPFLFCYILVFFLIFDLICNGFAEVTRFSDRQFYSDWWNSTTWDEFARKWNKPVHEWLLRHVYLESLKSFKGDRVAATLATFLCSAVVHELVLTVMMRMFRPWLFLLQMLQVPLILLGRFLKGTRAGNFFFWFGMVLGPPLLTILYCREYVMRMTPEETQEIHMNLLDNVPPTVLI